MKKELKTELTKEKIISAAIDEFGCNGYYGSSLNSICDTGIAKGLLYHNFANKDAIYLACVQRCFHELTEYLKAADIGTDLQRYASARTDFFMKNESMKRIFFEAVLQPPVALRSQIEKIRAEFDKYNNDLYISLLNTVKLRPGVTQKEALVYFRLTQEMFNGYFSSQVYSNSVQTEKGTGDDSPQLKKSSDKLDEHEHMLVKVIDYMLYGIAEK